MWINVNSYSSEKSILGKITLLIISVIFLLTIKLIPIPSTIKNRYYKLTKTIIMILVFSNENAIKKEKKMFLEVPHATNLQMLSALCVLFQYLVFLGGKAGPGGDVPKICWMVWMIVLCSKSNVPGWSRWCSWPKETVVISVMVITLVMMSWGSPMMNEVEDT